MLPAGDFTPVSVDLPAADDHAVVEPGIFCIVIVMGSPRLKPNPVICNEPPDSVVWFVTCMVGCGLGHPPNIKPRRRGPSPNQALERRKQTNPLAGPGEATGIPRSI